MVKTQKKNIHAKCFARSTAYHRGIIYCLALAEFAMQEIIDEVEKPDGSSLDLKTVRGVVRACEAKGGMAWNCALPQSNAGRPRTSTDAVDKKVMSFWRTSPVIINSQVFVSFLLALWPLHC